MSVYPNPAHNTITLTTPSSHKASQAPVYTLQGSRVISHIITATTQAIDITNLNQGTYILKVYNDLGVQNILFQKQ